MKDGKWGEAWLLVGVFGFHHAPLPSTFDSNFHNSFIIQLLSGSYYERRFLYYFPSKSWLKNFFIFFTLIFIKIPVFWWKIFASFWVFKPYNFIPFNEKEKLSLDFINKKPRLVLPMSAFLMWRHCRWPLSVY